MRLVRVSLGLAPSRCRDCRWCLREPRWFAYPLWDREDKTHQYDKCMSPRSVNNFFCDYARVSVAETECGPDGRYFMPWRWVPRYSLFSVLFPAWMLTAALVETLLIVRFIVRRGI